MTLAPRKVAAQMATAYGKNCLVRFSPSTLGGCKAYAYGYGHRGQFEQNRVRQKQARFLAEWRQFERILPTAAKLGCAVI